MKFNNLIQGKILKRYKRFFADIELPSGEVVVAHTPNTGSMKTCWEPGWPALISPSDNPKRKLKYTLEMTHNGDTWIGVHTGHPNKIVFDAISSGKIPKLDGYDKHRREVKIGDSRIDILCENDDEKCYVEVKNVTLKAEGKLALFPDAVSTRGQKHLKELIELKRQGIRACMFYLVQREDVDAFSPARDIDPEYARLLAEAVKSGVEVFAYKCQLNQSEIEISSPVITKI